MAYYDLVNATHHVNDKNSNGKSGKKKQLYLFSTKLINDYGYRSLASW